MIRLFVALEIPERVASAMLLLSGGVPGARWMNENQLHLTLRFIGEVDERTARDIDDVLCGVSVPKFLLEIAGVGEFGGKDPHALWAGVRPNDMLMRLHTKIENVFQRLGLSADKRKFTPHVTLARLKHAPREKVMEFIARRALFSQPPFVVERFALYSSQMSPNGSIYRVEQTYALD